MKPNTTSAINAILARIRNEYSGLGPAASARFSLREMLDHSQFRLEDFCSHYSPNSYAAEAHEAARRFGQRYGIWLENADHYISCVYYLYPSATPGGLRRIGKTFVIDYFLDNTMGRDKVGFLPCEQQQAAGVIKRRMAAINEDLILSPDASPVEQANIEMLSDLRKSSPGNWFTEFVLDWGRHIDLTYVDHNAVTIGYLSGVEEYIQHRRVYSGLYYSIKLLEIGDDQFLPWPHLTAIGLAHPLRRLYPLVADIWGLMNDLFSFENEFVDEGADCNLITLIALNDPSLSLSGAIDRAVIIVRSGLAEFVTLIAEVRGHGRRLLETDPAITSALESHLQGLERIVQSCWAWHIHTMRYKRAESIWLETRLNNR